MGTCLSTRRVFGSPREGDPKRSAPLPDDSNNKETTVEVNGKELRDSANSKYLPKDAHSKLLPNGVHSKHSRDGEHNKLVPDDAHKTHLPDDVDDKKKDREAKRRALLVGITYSNPWNTWSQLDGPHGDVDQYRDLLVSA